MPSLTSPNIKINRLNGTYYEMGQQYGISMHDELHASLAIIKEFYVTNNSIAYSILVTHASLFNQRYNPLYKDFLYGVSNSTGLNYQDMMVLNGMETLNSLVTQLPYPVNELSACSFLALPSAKTSTNSTFIGRFYDFPYPYNLIAQYLSITFIESPGHLKTAIIALPGQFYCPTCINENGIFVSLNNGMPSGGYTVNQSQPSLLTILLNYTQTYNSLGDLTDKLATSTTDYSLIINVADSQNFSSIEFSSTLGTKLYVSNSTGPFVSTNFYLNDTWQTPVPSDRTTWHGVTRRNNLLKLSSNQDIFNIDSFQQLMDTSIMQGGALDEHNAYRIIFDSANNHIYLKRPTDIGWTLVNFKELACEMSTDLVAVCEGTCDY
jgi:hypothetical protein